MTARAWLESAERALARAGCLDARADAEFMLAGALNVSRGRLKLIMDGEIPGAALALANARLERRASGEPLQYVENAAWFMGLEFYVDERVLIPRPDTETLCEAAISEIRASGRFGVLDLCTGSGALAIAVKRNIPSARVTATDISAQALDVARVNAARLGADIEFIKGDLFTPLKGRAFDVIMCNPPYIQRADMNHLQPEVLKEPELALDGGEDGLDIIRRVGTEIFSHMNAGALALIEVGAGQARAARELLAGERAAQTGVIKDICGIDRVIWIRSV